MSDSPSDAGLPADLLARIAALTQEQRALLETRLKEQAPPPDSTSKIVRRGIRSNVPPSFAQQRLWFLDQLNPGSPFYHVAAAHRLTGRLEEGALQKAFDAVVERHEVLRTRYVSVGGTPEQVIDDPYPVLINRIESKGLDSAALERLLNEEAARPYDLSRDRMLRVTLVQLGPDDHALLMVAHHIAIDGWSFPIMIREVSKVYTATVNGTRAELPELPVQYADFAFWQQEWLKGEEPRRQLAYWKRQLTAPLPVTNLPLDRPRPAVQRYHGGSVPFELPEELADEVRRFARENGLTPFMLLLATFKVFLHQYTGQTDLIVGTPMAGRHRSEIENLIGFFVNTVVIRSDLSGDPTFMDVVNRVRGVALDAIANQDVPFEKLVEELRPERSLSHNPIFQVMFTYQAGKERSVSLPGLESTPIPIRLNTSKFDMAFGFTPLGDRMIGKMRYNSDLFDRSTIEGMVDHYQELLQAALAEPDQPIAALPRPQPGKVIVVAGAGKPAPLAAAQEGLWVWHQMEPLSPAGNRPTALSIKGPLDRNVLAQCLTEIVSRHEPLRTIFPSSDGRPVQLVLPPDPVRVELHDLEHLPEEEREGAAEKLAALEALRPIDLEHGPIFRAVLYRLTEARHLLVLLTHHIVFDGWSEQVLHRELSALYAAFRAGKPSPLPELRTRYVEYAERQLKRLKNGALESQLAYWRRRLAGLPDTFSLRSDYPRPEALSHRGLKHSAVIPHDLTEKIKAWSRRERVTLYMTLLAAFKALLYRYTDREDVVVGTPVAGRLEADVEPLVGLFINAVVLRTGLSGDLAFRELVQKVRETTLEAFSHQEVPFDRLVEELHPERRYNRWPLFQILFQLRNLPHAEPMDGEVTFTSFELDAGINDGKDLSVDVTETAGGLVCTFRYAADLFRPDTIERFAGHYVNVLEGAVSDPERPVSHIPLLTENERRRIMEGWNRTYAAYPRDEYVHDWIERQAGRTPDATAIDFEDRRLTYRELNERANRLAHHLVALGVGPGRRVGLCVERSPEMIVGMLGILKAGGAYVPLDPSYPDTRLALMLDDARPEVLLTQHHLRERLPASGGQVVFVDPQEGNLSQYEPTAPPVHLTDEDVAYVMYTSGSTGRPKGVLVPHRALTNFTWAAGKAYGIRPDDRVLQFASISFDTAVEEIFPTLAAGAALVLRTESMLTSMAKFVEECSRYGITVLDLPTAFWHELTPALEPAKLSLPPLIRTVIIGGERARPDRLAEWKERVGSQVRLFNTYGPTETTVIATLQELTDRALSKDEEVPIGRPIANVWVYVLDRNMNPVPVGVPGELYIGGEGVALGYLNQPELTAQSFVPDPFGKTPGQVLYRTGDLARWLPDGALVFAGRKDEQVKIRGYRVEPGEVEAVLNQHPAVRESVVIITDDAAGEKRLVAYVAPSGDLELLPGALDEYVRSRLPSYMIPWQYVTVLALPLLPNGKVNKNALPAPPTAGGASTAVAPRTPVETRLLAIWKSVLGVDDIGVEDNFFALGGHSLLVMRVMAKVQDVFKTHLPIRYFFEAPTVASFARLLDSHSDLQKAKENPGAIKPVRRDGFRRKGFDAPETDT